MPKFYKKKTMKKTLVKKVAKLGKQMRTLKPDLKYVDTAFDGTVSTTGTIISLATVAKGTTGDTRIGDVIRVVRLELRGAYINGDPFNRARMTLVRDAQSVTALSINDVYDNNLGAFYIDCPYKLSSKSRVKVIADKRLATYNLLSASPGRILNFSITKNFKAGLVLNYNNATDGPIKNDFRMVMSSDSSITVHPTITWLCRVFFTDV